MRLFVMTWVAALATAQAAGQTTTSAVLTLEDVDRKLAALDAEIQRLERETRVQLLDQLEQAQRPYADDPDLAPQRKRLAEARKALDEREQTDLNIAAAEHDYETVDARYDARREELWKTDPELVAMRRRLAELEQQVDRAEYRQRKGRALLSAVRYTQYRDPNLRACDEKVREAEQALREVSKLSLSLAGAARTLRDAEKAWVELRDTLPEYQAYVKAREAFGERMKEDTGAIAARKAVERARRERDAVARRLAAEHPDGKAALELIEQARQAEQQARVAREKVRAEIDVLQRDLERNDEKLDELREQRNKAYSGKHQARRDMTADERRAVEAARQALENALAEKLASDEQAAAILQRIAELETRINDLRAYRDALRNQRAQLRRKR